MWSPKDINRGIHILCFLGLGLSYYAYVVETSKEHDENYTAVCDISEHVSCSKVFTSPYGRGFGLLRHIVGEDSVFNQPNSLGGMVFYCIVSCLNLVNTVPATKIMLGLVMVSNLASVYLAYILLYVLYDLCVVCVTTYAINLANLVLVMLKLHDLTRSSDRTQSPARSSQKKKN